MSARLGAPLLAALALAPLAMRWGPETYLLGFGAHALVLALAALSLAFMLGQGALASLGHAAFLGIGGYAVVIAASFDRNDIIEQCVYASLAAALFALGVGAASLRGSSVNMIMSTLAFGQMLYFLAVSLSAYGGDDGVTLAGRSTLLGAHALDGDIAFYYFTLGCLALAYLLFARLAGSRFGRVLGAIRQNPVRAQALGFQPFGYKLLAMVISGVVCACAGVLLANQIAFVSPAAMTWQRSGELLIMALLGGGSLPGAIIGAIGFLTAEETLSNYTEQWKLIMGPLLVLVAMFARGGVARLAGSRA